MKKSLLVAVDGSAPSLKGLEAAVKLALAMGYGLELVNVQPPVLLAPSVYGDAIRAIETAHAEASREVLTAAVAKAKSLGIPDANAVTLVGPPAESVADHSEQPRIWGVVVGAKGHSAIGRVLVGSVADRLVHICSKPVLVVR